MIQESAGRLIDDRVCEVREAGDIDPAPMRRSNKSLVENVRLGLVHSLHHMGVLCRDCISYQGSHATA
jgi:hypothetical protein